MHYRRKFGRSPSSPLDACITFEVSKVDKNRFIELDLGVETGNCRVEKYFQPFNGRAWDGVQVVSARRDRQQAYLRAGFSTFRWARVGCSHNSVSITSR